MQEGMKVRIGKKYAYSCSYDDAIGKEGVITSIYERISPYRLKGKHTICRVLIPDWMDWEVHIDDCIPIYVPNKESKSVLTRYDD